MWLRVTALFLLGLSFALGAGAQTGKQAVLDANNRFEAALKDGNAKELERMLLPGFVWIHGTGALWSREQLLASSAHGPRYISIEDDDVRTSVYGDAAVVTERSKRQYTSDTVPFLSRFTIVYAKRNGEWGVASMHSSQLQPNGQPLPLDRVMPPGSTHQPPSTAGKKN